MNITAKFSKYAVYIFLINVGLVVCVAGFKQATAQQSELTSANEVVGLNPPDVQIPQSDPPSLPSADSVAEVPSLVAKPTENPADVPSHEDPASNLAQPIDPQGDIPSIAPAVPSSAVSGSSGSGNDMVMEEILKAIRDGRKDLEVPPLSYPTLPGLPTPVPSTGPVAAGISAGLNSTTSISIQSMEQRLKTIAALTQSAQSLLKESQYLQSIGHASEADQLLQNAKTIQSMIARLALPPHS